MPAADPPAFKIRGPAATAAPVVLSSPHSGRHYPDDLLAQLRAEADSFRLLEDGPVDQLVGMCCEEGATLIAAAYPRLLVDLNRAPDELDPELVERGRGSAFRLTPKARAGLGVIPSRIGSRAIYARALRRDDILARLELAYHPYHRELARLLELRQAEFGSVLLLDCHSMPGAQGNLAPGIEVALGDRFSRSCHPEITEAAEAALRAIGLRCARNRPYAGGYITELYGAPGLQRHALQIEIRRDLFLDETTHRPNAGFAALQTGLRTLIPRLAATIVGLTQPAAAE